MAEAFLIHEKVRAQFGPVAGQYTKSVGHADPGALARVVELAEPASADRALDVATGAGHMALALAPLVAEVVAYDLTATMLTETMRNAGGRGLRNVTPVQGAAEGMPFPDDEFDVVTVRIAAHHFADIRAAVREMARVVRPGGRVLVIDTTVPEDDELDRAINEIELLRDPSHVRNYRPSEWREMLEAAGLTVVFVEQHEYTEDRRMDFATWTGRMRTPPEAVAELEHRLRHASPALRRVLDLSVEAGQIGFRLPLVTLVAVKSGLEASILIRTVTEAPCRPAGEKESRMGTTLFEKIWDAHRVEDLPTGETLLYIDRHLVHEVTSPQAFEGLRLSGRKVRRPDLSFATADHNVPTDAERMVVKDPLSLQQINTLQAACAEFGITYYGLDSDRQGIVHVIGPELGITLPGQTLVCGDSHTSTHGAFGSLAFGIGTSEVEHVLATQTLRSVRPKTYSIEVNGKLAQGVSAKDVILRVIRDIGTGGATGHVVEYRGSYLRSTMMAERMTICNMSIEAGARAGLIEPDETTFDYVTAVDRPFAPKGAQLEQLMADRRTLKTDPDAGFDAQYALQAEDLQPQVTWGTSPAMTTDVTGVIPQPEEVPFVNPVDVERALQYMGLQSGTRIQEIPLDVVFIGSCTNSRIEDLRVAAGVLKGRRVAPNVRVLVVPGSQQVRAQAEAEGLGRVFEEAGAEWRQAGCSMCLGMNPDQLRPGQRAASTSNRNFEGRQGRGGRTHLVSPAMAAAAAIAGRFVDIRDWA